MRPTRTCLTILAACTVAGLAGCKSDSSTPASTTTTPNASLVGLWTGTDSDNPTTTLNVIVNSANEFTAIRSDGVQFTGIMEVSGDTLVAAVAGYANFGASFPDSSVYGIGTLDGTVNPGTSLTATVSFTTNGGTSLPGSWSLVPGSLSSVASSLASVAGSYTDNATGATVSIAATGSIGSQDATTGCVLSGTIGTGDTAIDEYQVAYTLAGCRSNYAVLNGLSLTGMGYLDNSTSPASFTYAVTGSSAGSEYGIAATLTSRCARPHHPLGHPSGRGDPRSGKGHDCRRTCRHRAGQRGRREGH